MLLGILVGSGVVFCLLLKLGEWIFQSGYEQGARDFYRRDRREKEFGE